MTNDRFMIIPEAWADDPAVMGLAGPLALYFWLSRGSFFREHTETFDDVGPWVKKGLVVSRFTHDAFIAHMDKLELPLTERTSQRHLKGLTDAGLVRMVQRGGAGANASSILAIGFWVDNGGRMKVLARDWIERRGMDPATRDELLGIERGLTARREAQVTNRKGGHSGTDGEGSGTPSDKNVASDLPPRSDKNVASPSDKNVASDSASTPSQTAETAGPYIALPIGENKKGTYSLPEKAPGAPGEANHKATMTILAEAIYGAEGNVPKGTWPRIAKISGELRELTPPMQAYEARTLVTALLADGFWQGKLSLSNIVDQLAKQRGKKRGGIAAMREDVERRRAELVKDAPKPQFATVQEMLAHQRAEEARAKENK